MYKKVSRHLVLLTLLFQTTIWSSYALTTGQPHSTVQTLTKDNFDEALNDPANGLWLLKFYAPWCGHCKKLAPTLDKMAPYLAGKLAIGKVDCTSFSGKSLCESQKVRGYPTLKIYRDGDFFDYTGKRDADSMITFAEQMSLPAVKLVNSKMEFEQTVFSNGQSSSSGGGGGGGGADVAFLLYDSKAKKNKKDTVGAVENAKELVVEQYLSSTTATQVFGQVARKFQDRAHFGMLHPEKKEELEKFGLSIKSKGPLIAKIEKDELEPLVYSGKMNTLDLMDFVRDNNAALVTRLAHSNFRKLASMGRPLFLGISFGSDSQSLVLEELRNYAKNGKDKDKYRFAILDGMQWGQFLKQFSIEQQSENSAHQYLVLDTTKRIFYQNENVANLQEFLQGIENGTIPMREQSTQANANNGPLEKVHSFFVKHMPYLLVLLFVIVAGIVVFILNDNEDEIRYRELLEAQSERAKKVQEQRKQKPIKED